MKRVLLLSIFFLFSRYSTVHAHRSEHTPARLIGLNTIAFCAGAASQSCLYYIKKNYARQINAHVPYALDALSLALPWLTGKAVLMLPKTMHNGHNSALFLGLCAEAGWMASRIGHEFES